MNVKYALDIKTKTLYKDIDLDINDDLYIFPEDFLMIYKMPGKLYSGFIDFKIDEESRTIIECVWDEKSYQDYLGVVKNEAEEKQRKLDEVEKENNLLKAKIDVLSQNQEFLEDCLIEVGQIIYA